MTDAAPDRITPLPTVGRPAGTARAASPPPPLRLDRAPPGQSSRQLWLWVAAGFLFLALGWTALFTVARAAKIQSVPLATKGGGTR